ncbi:MAG: hypothetical protein HIU92_03080 [Proteobacteria bacterium]|nr:hypothetical protein [Pseudomonadota bacterium]
MNRLLLAAVAAAGLWLAAAPGASAACASGVYRAGCAGPNGAVVVRKPAPYYRAPAYRAAAPYYHPAAPYYRHPAGGVHCANGVYRAGCAGPRGAAVVRKPY